ncbi:SPBc2 prophage-derived glycosyltransferase SunS [bacterium HR21]|jgi:hypothetical protein|nr:SPBc2 prophage-derived glycosyltransferase SunS [bacterium HR21]
MLPLAVTILARDSAATIARAIRSVQPIARQIVVLDTGSDDDTPSQALRLGAEVYFARWEGDFAAARNLALRHVRMPWVLALDSDEELEGTTLLAQAHLLEDPGIGGIEVQLRSVVSPEARHRFVYSHWAVRLFRSAEGIGYCGRIHEQIRPALEARGWKLVRAPILIWHYGYTPDRVRLKAQRNAELLRRELEHSPADVWLRYHLGMALFELEENEEALEVLRPCSEHPGLQPEQRMWARLRAAQAALRLDRIAEVEQLLARPLPDPELEGLRRFVLAAAVLQQRRFAEALTLLDSPVVQGSPYVPQEELEGIRTALRRLLPAQ